MGNFWMEAVRKQRIGATEFDPVLAEIVSPDGQRRILRPQTAEVLAILLEAEGQLISKSDLMERVWPDTHVTDDSLVQCISEIRKALGSLDGRLLKTVPRKGYRLDVGNSLGQGTNLLTLTLRHRAGKLYGVTIALLVFVGIGVWFWFKPHYEGPVTVAVLPFANLSSDPAQDYLSDGMAMDLITDLSRVSALSVISRTSSFAFRGQPTDAREIGQLLGATHLVDGSVQRVGDRLRITSQLVDAATGAQLWADRYDREINEILALQDEVRAEIISALRVRLTPEEEDQLADGLTDSPKAYDLYLRGLQEISFFGEASNLRARRFFKMAIAEDPDFAAAYAQLAQVLSLAIENEWGGAMASEYYIGEAVETAKLGIQYDPRLPLAHWSLGRIYSRSYLSDEQNALSSLKKSIELDPNYADGYMMLASTQVKLGSPQEALANIEKGMRLNPEGPFWYGFTLCQAQYALGRYEAAASSCRKAIDKNPTVGWPRRWFIAAAGQLGRLDDAEWEMSELEALGEPVTIEDFTRRSGFMESTVEAALIEGLRKAGVPES